MYKNLTFALLLLIPLPILAEESVSEGLFKYHLNFAKEGSPESIYVIAGMYERGRGVKQDFQKALKWYKLALKKGNTRASKNIDKVLNKIALLKSGKLKSGNLENQKPENNKLEEKNLVSTLLEGGAMETKKLEIQILENEKQIKEPHTNDPRLKQQEPTETMPTVNVKLDGNDQVNEPLNKQNKAIIRQISINPSITKKTRSPAPLIEPQVATQEAQQNLGQQARQQKLNRLRVETEEAKQQSELVRARYEQLQEEKASLILQMTLEKELIRKQKIEIQKIKDQREIDQKNAEDK